jgi:hypothetical protein
MESNRISIPPASDEASSDTRKRTCEEYNNENASKRARVEDDTTTTNRGGTVYLPPEVWAKALECLEYNDVMQCTTISKFVPREVLPKVETLFIHNKKQLHPAHAKRFETGCVRTIFISCFAATSRTDRNQQNQGPDERSLFTVPFLQRFAKLEYVWFGGVKAGNDTLGYDDEPRRFSPTGVCYRRSLCFAAAPSQVHKSVVESFASAFRFGLLPKGLQIDGIFDQPRQSCCSQMRESSACIVCDSICKSGPLDAAYFGHLCLGFETRARHIRRREGGVEFLTSRPDCFWPMLMRYFDLAYDGELDVQEPGFMDDIRLLIDIGCNPGGLSREELAGYAGSFPRRPETIALVQELARVGFAIEEDALRGFVDELDISDDEDDEEFLLAAYQRADDEYEEDEEVDEDDVDQADDW